MLMAGNVGASQVARNAEDMSLVFRLSKLEPLNCRSSAVSTATVLPSHFWAILNMSQEYSGRQKEAQFHILKVFAM